MSKMDIAEAERLARGWLDNADVPDTDFICRAVLAMVKALRLVRPRGNIQRIMEQLDLTDSAPEEP